MSEYICPICDLAVNVQKEAHVFRWHKDQHYALHSTCKDDVSILTVGFDEVMGAILHNQNRRIELLKLGGNNNDNK